MEAELVIPNIQSAPNRSLFENIFFYKIIFRRECAVAAVV